MSQKRLEKCITQLNKKDFIDFGIDVFVFFISFKEREVFQIVNIYFGIIGYFEINVYIYVIGKEISLSGIRVILLWKRYFLRN